MDLMITSASSADIGREGIEGNTDFKYSEDSLSESNVLGQPGVRGSPESSNTVPL
eukprot:Gb_09572 [translate_table: standard]